MNAAGEEFGAVRLQDVVERAHLSSADEIVGAIFEAVQVFRGEAQTNDDMTAVAVKITI
jgi:serine phosphatase RsbU (regulator of sigma subunit)